MFYILHTLTCICQNWYFAVEFQVQFWYLSACAVTSAQFLRDNLLSNKSIVMHLEVNYKLRSHSVLLDWIAVSCGSHWGVTVGRQREVHSEQGGWSRLWTCLCDFLLSWHCWNYLFLLCCTFLIWKLQTTLFVTRLLWQLKACICENKSDYVNIRFFV